MNLICKKLALVCAVVVCWSTILKQCSIIFLSQNVFLKDSVVEWENLTRPGGKVMPLRADNLCRVRAASLLNTGHL
ncbi:hypothetical protein BON87_16985 [Escherichia coli]|nr:hypothetical protein BTW13_21450 [Escherichia coli]TFA23577.1 hypothetical protein BON87_16985 [Escherichia coli]